MVAKKQYRRVLTIAGSDSGGGAGIQADIKTISACWCYACSAITCVTAQNTVGVQAIEPLSVDIIRAQIDSVLSDIGVDAIKIGMLGSPEIACAIAAKLRNIDVPIVLDPVLVATSGDVLTKKETIEVIVNELIPLATVVTPNLEEARVLTGYDDERAWQFFREKGAKALLLKGGHGTEDELSDILFTFEKNYEYRNHRIHTKNTHGTGCSLSSAIASYLARGAEIHEAVEFAVEYVHRAIAAGADYELGGGHGAINHFYRFW